MVPNGYDISHIPRDGRPGGGVALIHRSTLHSGSQRKYTFLSFECIVCQLSYLTKSVSLTVVMIYRPPPSNMNRVTTTMFLDEFNDLLEEVVSSKGELLIVGDFNFHWDSMHDNNEASKMMDVLVSMNLKQHVIKPTHTSGHTLDLVISRTANPLVQSTYVGSFISDHAAVHCHLNINRQSHQKQELIYRKTKIINHIKFAEDIQASELILNPKTDLDELVHQYDSVLRRILDKHAPELKRIITVRSPRPWYNDNITNEKRLRKQLERRWRRTQSITDRTAFKSQRNLVVDMIKEARRKYYKNRIDELMNFTIL